MTLVLFRLATHLNAALADPDVKLGLLPEFEEDVEWVFLVPGPNGHKLRHTPDDWVATMRSLGAQCAWYGVGPSRDVRGEGIWTEGESGLCFYRLIESKAEDGHRRKTLTGFPGVSPQRPGIDVPAAADAFRKALAPMIALGEARRTSLTGRLEEAAAVLDGEAAPSPSALEAFPPGIYPPSHIRLCDAAHRGDVFLTGGQGSWFDEVGYDETSEAYAGALLDAAVAASRLASA